MPNILDIIAIPFGWLMYWCYSLLNNYGLALILFTLITKIILFPLSIKQQQNTARMALLNPKLEKLKKKCGNNKEKYQEEMMKLYSEENVNPASGCLPALIQLPILFGLYGVIYSPLTYVLRISSDVIGKAKAIFLDNSALFGSMASESSFNQRPELYVMQAVHKSPDTFNSLGKDFINNVSGFDLNFFGMNLGDTPSFALNILILIPVISFIANLALTIYTQRMSKKNNPAAQQMGAGMNAMLYIMPVFSAVFAFQFPAGVGLYWIFSSVFGLLQSMLLYRMYTPEKMAEIVEKQKEKNKGKAKKPTMYERAMQAQKLRQEGAQPSVSTDNDDNDNNDNREDKLSKSEIKDMQRHRLNEARRRMAEKYGDGIDDSFDE